MTMSFNDRWQLTLAVGLAACAPAHGTLVSGDSRSLSGSAGDASATLLDSVDASVTFTAGLTLEQRTALWELFGVFGVPVLLLFALNVAFVHRRLRYRLARLPSYLASAVEQWGAVEALRRPRAWTEPRIPGDVCFCTFHILSV